MPVDVDFSFALNDRTGKLFLGRDIIAALGDRVASVRYGRLSAFPRVDLLRRVAGRLTHEETWARVFRPRLAAPLRRMRTPYPTLHLDPLSVVRHRLDSRDIVLCHDIGPITHPGYFAPGVDELYACAYGQIRERRPHMVFDSHTSQQEFHRLFGDDYPSSTMIYIPTRPEMKQTEEIAPTGVSGPFLLTVGSIGSRKNQARCIDAFAHSGLADRGWHYVLVGGPEPGADAVVDLARRTPGVILPGYASDAELRWLYRRAGGFVLMSLLEGFGMPVIEAAEHGLPCLVTESSVLSEIGGPAMLRADPLDPAAIAAGMRRLADMPDAERAERAARTTDHTHRFAREPILQQWRALVDRLASGA